jgi:hypothetical protein
MLPDNQTELNITFIQPARAAAGCRVFDVNSMWMILAAPTSLRSIGHQKREPGKHTTTVTR